MATKFLLAILFSVLNCTLALNPNFSPVLLFKHKENPTSFPKSIISSTTPYDQREFERLISTYDNDQKIIFFVMPELSPEDFSIRDEDNIKGFQNLASGVDLVDYIPYVENAVDNKVTKSQSVELASVSTINELEPEPSSNARIIIVSLPQRHSSESKFHYLARIDRACFAISQLDKYRDALFVLTSEKNSHLEQHSRKAREANQQQQRGNTYKSANSLVYFTDFFEHLKNKDNTNRIDISVTISGVTTTKPSEHEVKIEFASKHPLSLMFDYDPTTDYWYLNVSKSTVDAKPFQLSTDIVVPRGFSFSCSSSAYFKLSDDEKVDGVYFKGLQLQVNFGNETEELKTFGDAYDCVGFTNAAIWAGLFVTFLMLFIVSVAITYIMDIRSMDRFDDPKGKTITVTATD